MHSGLFWVFVGFFVPKTTKCKRGFNTNRRFFFLFCLIATSQTLFSTRLKRERLASHCGKDTSDSKRFRQWSGREMLKRRASRPRGWGGGGSASAHRYSFSSGDQTAQPAVLGEIGRRVSNFPLQTQLLETTRSPLASEAQ